MASVCVYCGSSFGNQAVFRDAAHEVGALLAAGGHSLVYGGGNVGLMGVVADAMLEGGGSVTGVIPRSMVDLEVAHRGLTELVVTDTMHERKAVLADRSDGFITLPGGFGTLDESFEILTWSQLGYIAKPLVFLDVADYWKSLFDQIEVMIDSALVRPEHASLPQRSTSAAQAVALATAAFVAPPPKWVDR